MLVTLPLTASVGTRTVCPDQCKDFDIVITTALIPAEESFYSLKKINDDMKPVSVVVELAAEASWW